MNYHMKTQQAMSTHFSLQREMNKADKLLNIKEMREQDCRWISIVWTARSSAHGVLTLNNNNRG